MWFSTWEKPNWEFIPEWEKRRGSSRWSARTSINVAKLYESL